VSEKVYDDELLKETEDDIVKPRNAPPRRQSGWGIAPVVIAILGGLVVGAIIAITMRPTPGPVMPSDHPDIDSGPVVSEQQVLEMSELDERISANPQDVDALIQRAVLNANLENFVLAKEDAEAVLALQPDSSVAYYVLGVYYNVTGECSLAEENWGKALELNPDGDATGIMKALRECYVQAGSPVLPTGQ